MAAVEAINIVEQNGISRMICANQFTIIPVKRRITRLFVVVSGMERIAIHTDSEFLFKAMTSYIYQWLGNGWVRSNGKPVVNEPEFRSLLFAMEDMDVEWVR